MKPLVPILMGSGRDLDRGKAIAKYLDKFGLESEIRVCSAHKTPEHALNILKAYEADGRPKVYVTIAGRSNALSGFVDGQVKAPVVGCPPLSADYAGIDVWSTLRMPSGVAPATVLEPEATALLCAKILGLTVPGLADKVADYQQQMRREVTESDAGLRPAEVG